MNKVYFTKRITFIIAIVSIIILAGIAILAYNNDKDSDPATSQKLSENLETNDKQNNKEEIEDISKIEMQEQVEENLESENDNNFAEGQYQAKTNFNFKNRADFEYDYSETFSSSSPCYSGQKFALNSEYLKSPNSDHFAITLKEPENSIGYYEPFSRAITAMANVLDEYELRYDEKEYLTSQLIRGASCGRIPTPPLLIKDLNYSLTDSAKLLIKYGSRHFVIPYEETPISFSIIARKGDDYLFIDSSKTLNLLDFMKDENNLENCATTDAQGNKTLAFKDPQVEACVEKELIEFMDMEKIDAESSKIVEVYELT